MNKTVSFDKKVSKQGNSLAIHCTKELKLLGADKDSVVRVTIEVLDGFDELEEKE